MGLRRALPPGLRGPPRRPPRSTANIEAAQPPAPLRAPQATATAHRAPRPVGLGVAEGVHRAELLPVPLPLRLDLHEAEAGLHAGLRRRAALLRIRDVKLRQTASVAGVRAVPTIRTWPEFGRAPKWIMRGPSLVELEPGLAKFGPILAFVGRVRPEFGVSQNLHEIGRLWLKLARRLSRSVQIWTNSAKSSGNRVRCWLTSATRCPKQNNAARSLAEIAIGPDLQKSARFGLRELGV